MYPSEQLQGSPDVEPTGGIILADVVLRKRERHVSKMRLRRPGLTQSDFFGSEEVQQNLVARVSFSHVASALASLSERDIRRTVR